MKLRLLVMCVFLGASAQLVSANQNLSFNANGSVNNPPAIMPENVRNTNFSRNSNCINGNSDGSSNYNNDTNNIYNNSVNAQN